MLHLYKQTQYLRPDFVAQFIVYTVPKPNPHLQTEQGNAYLPKGSRISNCRMEYSSHGI